MSRVVTVFRVYPEDNMLEKALANIKEQLKPDGIQTEEVAFGIRLIKVMFKFEDTEQSSSKIEESLRKIGGVKEVEVADETLL